MHGHLTSQQGGDALNANLNRLSDTSSTASTFSRSCCICCCSSKSSGSVFLHAELNSAHTKKMKKREMRALTAGAARRAAECRWAHLKRISGIFEVLCLILCTRARHSSQFIRRHAALSSSSCTCPKRLLKRSDSRVNELNNDLVQKHETNQCETPAPRIFQSTPR